MTRRRSRSHFVTSRTQIPLLRKVAYSGFVLASFLLLTEGLLAIAKIDPRVVTQDPYVGFERHLPLFVEQMGHDGSVVMTTARNKLAYFNPQQFIQEKPANTYRVFCLGGSTTYGRPYDDRTSFPGWLRELLSASSSQRRWEVINAGGISYASYRIATVMEELCQYSPDLFVVYTGHNEFLEERTYRELRAQPKWLHDSASFLYRTRTFSLVHELLGPAEVERTKRFILPGEVDAVLDHAVGPDSYHRDELLRARILEHFELNIERMIALARSAGAEVVLVTPASNVRDFTPFKSVNRDDLSIADKQKWSELLAEAASHEVRGEIDDALAAMTKAVAIDDRHAAMHCRWGRLLFAAGRISEAQTAFVRAIEEDVCPLRALPEMCDAIERVAISNDVPLVDFNAILQNDCMHFYGHDLPGNEYFLDHVHPTIEANRLLAIAIVEALTQRGMTGLGPQWRDEAVRIATTRIESAVDSQLQAAALTNLAQVLSWAGKQQEAGPIALRAVQLRAAQGLEEDVESLFYAGVHLAMTGEDDAAMELLRRVVARQPDHVQARWRLAALLYDQATLDEAASHLEVVLRLDPEDAYSHSMLGEIRLKTGEFEQAVSHFREVVRLDPDSRAAREALQNARQAMEDQPGGGA